MGLGKWLSRLVKDANPTQEWIADPSRELHVDFDKPSIGGVAAGQPMKDLSWLGPAERAKENGLYEFLGKGLTVSEQDGRFDWFGLEFHGNDGFQPFQGACSAKGQPLELSAATTLDDLIEQLGESADREIETGDGGEQITLTYQLGAEFAFNFQPDDNGVQRLHAAFG